MHDQFEPLSMDNSSLNNISISTFLKFHYQFWNQAIKKIPWVFRLKTIKFPINFQLLQVC